MRIMRERTVQEVLLQECLLPLCHINLFQTDECSSILHGLVLCLSVPAPGRIPNVRQGFDRAKTRIPSSRTYNMALYDRDFSSVIFISLHDIRNPSSREVAQKLISAHRELSKIYLKPDKLRSPT